MPHSSFWRAFAAARSPDGQVAVMQAFAAFWKFMFVQTQPKSALEGAVRQVRWYSIPRRRRLNTYKDEQPAAAAAAAEQLMMQASRPI